MASDLGLHCLLRTVCPVLRLKGIVQYMFIRYNMVICFWVYISSSGLSVQELEYVSYSTASIYLM